MDSVRREYPDFLKQVFAREEHPDIIIERKAAELVEYSRSLKKWTKAEYRLFNDVNRDKNRYLHRIPYERHRVKLKYKGDQPGYDYVNASHLNAGGGTTRYIASQAPIPSTFADFWHMIWEQDVRMIVMLVAIQNRRCEQYWPTQSIPLLFAGITIECISERDIIPNEIIQRRFMLTYDGESRIVSQLHYMTWPDHGVPQSFDLMESVLKCCRADENFKAPILVHCSAGIGRTGTYCVLDSILYHYHQSGTFENSDPVLSTIKQFRDQRNDMVETFEQLEFIYKFLHDYFSVLNT